MWSALFLLAAGLSAEVVTLDGAPSDALTRPGAPGEIWVTATRQSGRVLVPVSGGAAVPVTPDAIFVDAFADDTGPHFVFVTKRGLSDETGRGLVTGPGIFSLTDPDRLYVLPSTGPDGELRFYVSGGIIVRRPAGDTVTLRYQHKSRLYSGRTQRGLNPQKRYAAALSVYAPQVFDVDLDHDGDRDAVVLLHDTVLTYPRGPDGQLATRPTTAFSLRDRLREVKTEDLHVNAGDLDGDGRADLVIGAHQGRLPERSSAYWIRSTEKGPLTTTKKLWTKDGFVEPLMVLPGRGVLASRIDTSFVSLGSVLVSGSAGVDMVVFDEGGREKSQGPTVEVGVDVRRGQMAGSMPVTEVDFDGDGREDLLAFTEDEAFLYLATARGIAKQPVGRAKVALFVHTVPLPAARAVVLVHATDTAQGRVTVLRADPAAQQAHPRSRSGR